MSAVELDVGGMTCAAGAARGREALNRMPGLQASVNFAPERGSVAFPSGAGVADLVWTSPWYRATSTGHRTLLSRATLDTIRANLFWAFAHNVAAVPLAAQRGDSGTRGGGDGAVRPLRRRQRPAPAVPAAPR